MTIESVKQARTLKGIVVSNKMDKTIKVRVDRRVQHPLYGKTVTRSTRFAAHDEKNETEEGDWVLIRQSRPLSKTKHWVLVEILERANQRAV